MLSDGKAAIKFKLNPEGMADSFTGSVNLEELYHRNMLTAIQLLLPYNA